MKHERIEGEKDTQDDGMRKADERLIRTNSNEDKSQNNLGNMRSFE